MNLLKFLFGGSDTPATPAVVTTRKRGTRPAKLIDDGAMVDGKPTYEYAQTHKDDLAMMLRCCDAELQAMWQTHLSPAPAFAERAAILYRRQGDYAREIEICERYLVELDRFLAVPQHQGQAGAREGGIAQKLRDRIVRARALQAKA